MARAELSLLLYYITLLGALLFLYWVLYVCSFCTSKYVFICRPWMTVFLPWFSDLFFFSLLCAAYECELGLAFRMGQKRTAVMHRRGLLWHDAQQEMGSRICVFVFHYYLKGPISCQSRWTPKIKNTRKKGFYSWTPLRGNKYLLLLLQKYRAAYDY